MNESNVVNLAERRDEKEGYDSGSLVCGWKFGVVLLAFPDTEGNLIEVKLAPETAVNLAAHLLECSLKAQGVKE